MSFDTATTRTHRGQQTLHEAVNARVIHEPLIGVHRRFELPREADLLIGDQHHKYVVLNFSDVETVIDNTGTLDSLLEPRHLPVILGTVDDELLDERTFQDILNVLVVAQPAIYVPDIVWNNEQLDDEEQEMAIEAYLLHVRTLQEEVTERSLSVRILPTNKGWTVDHFAMYEDLYADYGYSEIAFYAVEYTGEGAGNAIRKLRRHTTNAIAALNLDNVYLIGRLARDDLLRFDPEVKGACGLRRAKDADSFPKLQHRLEQALFANNDQTQRYLEDYR